MDSWRGAPSPLNLPLSLSTRFVVYQQFAAKVCVKRSCFTVHSSLITNVPFLPPCSKGVPAIPNFGRFFYLPYTLSQNYQIWRGNTWWRGMYRILRVSHACQPKSGFSALLQFWGFCIYVDDIFYPRGQIVGSEMDRNCVMLGLFELALRWLIDWLIEWPIIGSWLGLELGLGLVLVYC